MSYTSLAGARYSVIFFLVYPLGLANQCFSRPLNSHLDPYPLKPRYLSGVSYTLPLTASIFLPVLPSPFPLILVQWDHI